MDYFDAVKATSAALKAGDIIAYSTDYTSDTGRRIFVEYRDSGWCPYPAWQEYEPDNHWDDVPFDY